MALYHSNIQQYEDKLATLTQSLNSLSTYRLAGFIFSFIIIAYLANERQIALLFIAIPLCVMGFGIIIKRYNQVAFQKRHTYLLKEINEEEVLRLENKLASFPTGEVYINRDHPYAADLDTFGQHSLFQLINRTTTESGNVCLAEWLSEPATKDVILERQEAIQELTPKLEWRQDFQASGMHFRNAKSDYKKLLDWIEKPVELLPHQTKYLVGSIFLAILATSAAVYFAIQAFAANNFTGVAPLLIILLCNYFVLRKVAHLAEDIIDSTHENVKILGGYQSLIVKIESVKFHSKLLQQLQSTFSHHNFSAASEINKLKKILDIFQLRGTKKSDSNKFYPIFNILWLFDIYWILLTEKWKVRNSSHLRSWAAAVSEFEVLSSLAGFHYANPSFNFPEITKQHYSIHFEELGHPLISPKSRVCNNFDLESRGEIAMITGSNMAGKSTFLRTVGVNMVLAFMGAPCCAKSGHVSSIQLFTSMRTQDNLEEGISSFYAELRRIEQLLELIKGGNPIFFLLDEMFKGTNSQDRYKGGVSLIKQLSELNAFGLISTHDLELAKLAGHHLMVSNHSFNSEIQQGEMTFNYKLTEGICQDFNASELMKRSGIKILSSDWLLDA